MIRLAVPVAIAFAASQTMAETLCDPLADTMACPPILGCVGDTGRWFRGFVSGYDEGPVEVGFDDGTSCSGQSSPDESLGVGVIEMSCSDGDRIILLHFYEDLHSDTVISRGETRDRTVVRGWAGFDAPRYLADEENGAGARALCGSLPELDW